jgi:hypothetical protein
MFRRLLLGVMIMLCNYFLEYFVISRPLLVILVVYFSIWGHRNCGAKTNLPCHFKLSLQIKYKPLILTEWVKETATKAAKTTF